MKRDLESTLILCLDLLEQGESIEQILTRFPDEAEQLRPLLNTAVQLAQFKLNPSLAAQKRSKEAFLARAEALRTASGSRGLALFRWPRLVMPLVALVLVLLFGAGLVNSSAAASPGDPLYGTKRLVEKIRLSLALDSAGRSDLTARFNQERIQEIQMLLDEGRSAAIEFEGSVESIGPDVWTIAGLEARVNEDTEFNGVPQIGDLVAVSGRTLAGALFAEVISLLPGNEQPPPSATPTAKPTATATVEPTSTPTLVSDAPQSPLPSPEAPESSKPTDTPAAGATDTATATQTPSPTPTYTPSPTPGSPAIPGPSPTSTRDSNDNDDDEPDDDNHNENENHNDSDHGDDNENINGSSNDNSANINGG